ncbi:MAG: Bax inhibitor-1/YccA family protein [Treponema sp.]|nr:Bax inhibitor-1/YccA family protein [Candidatus Treponema equifaecale]
MENTLSLTKSEQSAFVTRTYGWMAVALLISAIAAYWTSMNIFTVEENRLGFTAFGAFLFAGAKIGFWMLVIAEFILVFVLSAKIRTMSVMGATLGFLAYSVINGITLSSIFIVYQIASIAGAFFGCAAMFGLMSFYGLTTKKNLNSLGHYMMMGLIGIIISSAVQFVLKLITPADFTMLNYLISFVTVVVFTGLTAYDSQKIIKTAQHAKNNEDYKKVSILAALELYLDFINLFLALLRLFGKRK